MMANIDFSTGAGPWVQQQLEQERVVWLTTVAHSGTPQPNVVWFLWDGESILVYSQPESFRVRNIERNRRISLNFNTDTHGSHMIVITGDAFIDSSAPGAFDSQAYIDKYADGLAELNMTPESFSAEYSTLIRIVPDRIRGF